MSNFNLLAEELSSANSDVETRIKAATQLLNNIEHYISGPIQAKFTKLIPIFINYLKSTPVLSQEQKLRNCILKILCQLPRNPPGPFEQYTKDVVDLFIHLVRTDNEENGLLCIKVIMDIIPLLGDKFEPLLALVQDMFDQIESVVIDQLDNQLPHNSKPGIPPRTSHTHENSSQPGSSVASDIGLGLQQTPGLLQAMASFKVLAECSTIAESIIKSSVSINSSVNIKRFFPLIKSVLLLQAKHQKQAHAAAAADGTIFIGASPNIRKKAAYEGFIRTQVNAISFLAHLMPNSDQLRDLTEIGLATLPDILIQLLKDCPREKSGIREELLVATRQIINFNFRKIFLNRVVELLDERTLIGDGLTFYKTRILAFTMLTDQIYHLRGALKPPEIQKTVEIFTKNLQDNFPGTGFPTMIARFLLIMAEYIAKMPNKVDARYYLIMILNAIRSKFAAMNQQYPNAVKLSKLYAQYAQRSVDALPDNYLADKNHLPDWDEVDIFTAMPIKIWSPQGCSDDLVADNKLLFKTLINALKNIFDQLKVCKIGSPIDPVNTYGFTAEEVQVIIKLFYEGAYVFRYYEIDISSTKEDKDLLETFVAVLRDQIPTAQLSEISPTFMEQYERMNRHKVRCSPIRVAPRKNLIRSLKEIWFTATSCICIKPSFEGIDDRWLDVEKGALKTRNSTSQDTWNLPQELLGKIEQQNYGRSLAQILVHPKSGSLRKVVIENINILIENSGDMGAEKDTRYTAMINSIHIVHSLCKFEGDREWMDKDIIIWCKRVGKNLRNNTLPPHLRLAAEQASEQLMVIFTKFLEYHPTDLDSLFSLIDSVANEDIQPTQPFSTHIHRIICSNSIEYWKTIVLRSLEVYASKSTQKTKTFLLRKIVNPIIKMNGKQPSTKSLMDKAVIESIHTKIWSDPNDDLTQPGIDCTRMEALQLTAMLVQYHHSVLRDKWQDIIKFGFTHTRFGDIEHAAYVVIGHCIAKFGAPAETILQVYTSLLESSYDGGGHTCRTFVMQALELIAPKLCNLGDRNPIWADIPHRILTEERQNIQQRTTVLCFLVKHPDFFYKYLRQFITPIVQSLRMIAQPSDASHESKQLVLQLITLVRQWEKRKSEYKIPTWARAAIINYLAEVIVSLRKRLPPLSASPKAVTASHSPILPLFLMQMINSMSLLHSLLHPQCWGDLDINLSNIIETLPVGDKWISAAQHGLMGLRKELRKELRRALRRVRKETRKGTKKGL